VCLLSGFICSTAQSATVSLISSDPFFAITDDKILSVQGYRRGHSEDSLSNYLQSEAPLLGLPSQGELFMFRSGNEKRYLTSYSFGRGEKSTTQQTGR